MPGFLSLVESLEKEPEGSVFVVPLPGCLSKPPGSLLKIPIPGASLVAQWLRVRLPMQGTRVQALVWELDPTCRGATKPVLHNY